MSLRVRCSLSVFRFRSLIAFEDVSCIYFRLNIVKAGVVAVCDDCVRLALEPVEVVDYFAAEEGGAVFERWLVDDDFRSLGFDALHDTLDG